jgi:hypothetical protein
MRNEKKAWQSPVFWLLVSLAVVGVVAFFGPSEKSLGTNVRVVYLHGAWVWASLAAFVAAAGFGLAGLAIRRKSLQLWSRALGRTGLIFWITYLPISIWAMQTNWNGLYLSEPRWRLAVVFAIGGLLLQIGVSLLEEPAWASALNVIYLLVLFLALRSTDQVMHPASPIFASNAWRIQLFFAVLSSAVLLAAWQVARWWHQVELIHTQS